MPGPMTSDGSKYGSANRRLERALADGDLGRAVSASRELPRVGLQDAAKILFLMARNRDRRYAKATAAARWLSRFAAEVKDVTPERLAQVADALADLEHADPDAAGKWPLVSVRGGLMLTAGLNRAPLRGASREEIVGPSSEDAGAAGGLGGLMLRVLERMASLRLGMPVHQVALAAPVHPGACCAGAPGGAGCAGAPGGGCYAGAPGEALTVLRRCGWSLWRPVPMCSTVGLVVK